MKGMFGKKLALAVTLYLAMGIHGEAQAMSTSQVGFGGKDFFAVYYYGLEDAGNPSAAKMFSSLASYGANSLVYTLKDDIKAGVNRSFGQWSEILGAGLKNTRPVQYYVGTLDVPNAEATSQSFSYGKKTFNPDYLHEALQNGTPIEWADDISQFADNAGENVAARGYARIYIGKDLGVDENDGRYSLVAPQTPSPLAQEMKGVDVIPVMFHELGHSLGFNEEPTLKELGGINYGVFTDAVKNAKSYAAHLYDQTGRRADGNISFIVTPEGKEQILAQAGSENLTDANFFVTDSKDALTGRSGRAYMTFRGEHVIDALGGKTFPGANGEAVSGLPVLSWAGDSELDFSHSNLARSLMSHQSYRSYNNFMEAELAVMQDIGYKIDRRNFYGRSVYTDGGTILNSQGFSARNSAGTAYVDGYNTATYGVGLHVYGSNNKITQTGNIYAAGDASLGIRIDGLSDTVTVAKGTEVRGDGTNGAGILVAYGKEHVINVDGLVTGTGKGGAGVCFDFGANIMGASVEYRGSYMRYKRALEDGVVDFGYNVGLNKIAEGDEDFSFTNFKDGDLNGKMASLNVSGTIKGGDKGAVYISPNAFVDSININQGANLSGDIVSKWKNFAADSAMNNLILQYNDQIISHDKYVPDLVTDLNFNADMSYSGNISGSDNMKLNVKGGTLLYGGAADVLNVNVAKGANVYGGTFTVNDMTERIAQGFSDNTSGKFFNHGMIGAASENTNMTINGELISDGYLQGYAAGSAGQIKVTGSANIDGSTASLANALPGESRTVLTAASVSGSVTNANTPYHATGMLDNYGSVTEDAVSVTAAAANNLGAISSRQQETYQAMQNMYQGLDNSQREEMRPLYQLDTAGAKTALSEISSSDAPQLMSLAQQSSIVGDVIGDRLNTAFAKAASDVPMESSVKSDNDAWVKFTKHWGDMKSGANYHGQAISGGYDRAVGKNWRIGTFVSYNAMGYGAKSSNGNIYDTRFGFYGGYHKGASDAYVYLDYGWQKNKLRRNLMGMTATADYDSHLIELGGEYKYDLHADDGKVWHVSPYAGLQLSYLRHGSYGETGAGIYNHRIDARNNTYFAMHTGVEFKRYLKSGSYGMRLGVKHAFSGADPNLSFHYEGDAKNRYTLANSQDKTHFIFSLSADTEFAPGWQIAGDAALQKGSHDKDLSAGITLRRMW